MCNLNFIDLFAGAGGLSEGFIRAGYTPLAHIEMDKYACDTLRTRAAFHWLKENKQLNKYKKYLKEKKEKEDGSKLWSLICTNTSSYTWNCKVRRQLRWLALNMSTRHFTSNGSPLWMNRSW